MFCCSIGKTRQIQQPRMTGQEGHDRACARTRTRTTTSREVAVSGTALTAAAMEEQQPQEESSLLCSLLPRRKNQLLAVRFSKKAAESVTLSPRVLSNH